MNIHPSCSKCKPQLLAVKAISHIIARAFGSSILVRPWILGISILAYFLFLDRVNGWEVSKSSFKICKAEQDTHEARLIQVCETAVTRC